ncbi:ABC transporter ATP-binding protein [Cyanobium sp. CH-040]|uniref:ABC transporter ATP-binding protein n=1 Tax=Cyanobium sp. CH-040 TaxID=2823708 RepID=UPI0020CE3D8C|nr:ABC transporter ATP-binding protein [Cyanobium sp. CH-040]MCP9927610.1 ABC transporter ATP-binding protein [Cyanobium sp. CH-040]
MLELSGVRYQPATAAGPVLDDVSLRLEAGRLGLVAGPSGGGKTTLLEVIGGLAEPERGTIRWNGEVLSGRQRRWLCGLVFQFPERHFLGLTVGQELRLGHRRLEAGRVEQVLARVGLGQQSLRQQPERLSGGQQRRLALAVQLLRDPRVLLLDEPTAGLDWAVRSEVVGLLGDLAKERAVLVVTHEPELFAALEPLSWRLEGGRLNPMDEKALRTMPAARGQG